MAEYINVEKPFLDKLRQLGWQVIDQGIGVPQDPAKSLREHFKQVLLPISFKGTERIVFTLTVTSSPLVPSPRVTARISFPCS
jgi:hypothetical protein